VRAAPDSVLAEAQRLSQTYTRASVTSLKHLADHIAQEFSIREHELFTAPTHREAAGAIPPEFNTRLFGNCSRHRSQPRQWPTF
jgi:hypothetical protein